LCMAWVSGLVAGVQPLATERESRMLDWLDALPVTRREIWRSKAAAAAGITVAVTLVLFIVTITLATLPPNQSAFGIVLPLVIIDVHGLASGLLGSAIARTAMGAFGWAILIQSVTATVFAIVAIPLLNQFWYQARDAFVMLLAVAAAAIPLVI